MGFREKNVRQHIRSLLNIYRYPVFNPYTMKQNLLPARAYNFSLIPFGKNRQSRRNLCGDQVSKRKKLKR